MFRLLYKKRKGSLTVEAAIVLPLVIITLLFIANILNICMVHLCMQQSLNNTAKKISQDSYLIYRIAGENNYSEFINKLGNIDDDYKEFEGKATDVKNSFDGLQKSIGESIKSTDVLLNDTFKDFEIKNIKVFCTKLDTNFNNFLNKWKITMNNISKTVNSIKELCINGKKNIKSVVIKLLTDGITGVATTSIVKSVFDTYRKELKAPSATNIDEKSIIPFHTTLNPKDGTFTIAMNYIYKNPFGFVNSKSTEYSIINKTIRMTNVITIRPFVGKNGSSLVGSVKEIDVENVDMEEVDIASASEIDKKIASESEIKNLSENDEKLKQAILEKKLDVQLYHNKNCISFEIREASSSIVKWDDRDRYYWNESNINSAARELFKMCYGREPLTSNMVDLYMLYQIRLELFDETELKIRYIYEPCPDCGAKPKNELSGDETVYLLQYDFISDDERFDRLYHMSFMCSRLLEQRRLIEDNALMFKEEFVNTCDLSLDEFSEELYPLIQEYTKLDEDYLKTHSKDIKVDFRWSDPSLGEFYFIKVPCPYCGG